MADIEHYWKMAKQLVRWHKQRHWPVAEQIRDGLSGFSNLTDLEIFDADFKLADAQQLVAAQNGCDSWEDLKNELANRHRDSTKAEPQPDLKEAIPCLWVVDVESTCEFYRERLGFDVEFKYGEPPYYSQLHRDTVRLALRHVDEAVPETERQRRRSEDLLATTIVVESVKGLFEEFVQADVSFHQKLRTEPWGARTFIVEDPEGNLIGFTN